MQRARYLHHSVAAMSKRIAFTVHGQVQGVFFRQTTTETADSLNVTGWVKNASDGTVQGEAQGDESKLNDFVAFLNKGPKHASVNKVEQKNIDVKEGETGFEG